MPESAWNMDSHDELAAAIRSARHLVQDARAMLKQQLGEQIPLPARPAAYRWVSVHSRTLFPHYIQI